LPVFALQSGEVVGKRILADLVAFMGIAEVEKMGGILEPVRRKIFLAAVRRASDEQKRRARKR
jgi:hypothetical protein